MELIDQIGNHLHFTATPKRIVSLVPSMTELIIDLAGQENVVGRTKFCFHPAQSVKEIYRIGGTKNPRIEDIIKLNPDLILANKEENNKEDVDHLSDCAPVYVSNVKTLDDNYHMISDLGLICDNKQESDKIIDLCRNRILDSPEFNGTVAYLIWKDPYMVAGGDTYIQSMLSAIGLKNIFEKRDRYPETSIDQIIELNPDYIFLSSEPYPFKKIHVEEWIKLIPTTKVELVDGEYFSWYGSRIIKKTGFIL